MVSSATIFPREGPSVPHLLRNLSCASRPSFTGRGSVVVALIYSTQRTKSAREALCPKSEDGPNLLPDQFMHFANRALLGPFRNRCLDPILSWLESVNGKAFKLRNLTWAGCGIDVNTSDSGKPTLPEM
jgi:hypothetical protein